MPHTYERAGRYTRTEEERLKKIDLFPFTKLEIVPFLCIDSSWEVRFKWLWDDFAGPNETYTGYVDYIDRVPWGMITAEDGISRSSFPAVQAQYIPTYAGDIIGRVEGLIDLMIHDHIDDKRIVASLIKTDGTECTDFVVLRHIFNRDYGPYVMPCPVVMSRPATHVWRGPGNLCDNAHQSNLCTAGMACDGRIGLRETGYGYDREFFADYLMFSKEMCVSDIGERLPRGNTFDNVRAGSPRLIVYTIGTGSISRIGVNGVWHVVSSGYFPPYGDPYNYDYHGNRAVIVNPGIRFISRETVRLDVELVAPRPEDLGAQVVFALAYNLPVDRLALIK